MKTDITIPTNIRITPKDRETRAHSLTQIEGDGSPRSIRLERMEFVIGRDEDADLCIRSQRASRRHAILARQGMDYVIRDNDSRNGVFLNGVKIHSAVLRDGDYLQLADSVFSYHEG